jgi:hypothetical protein
MKKVDLLNFTHDREGYKVCLGNGTIHYFSNEKAVKKFLVDTNKFLTRQLYDVRSIYISTWTIYQNNWCYFKHDKATMGIQQYVDDRTLAADLAQCQENFNYVISRCQYTNGNHFTFRHLLQSIELLKHCIKVLDQLFAKKSNAMDTYANQSLFRRLLQAETEINQYGQLEARAFFKLPEVLDEFHEIVPNLIAI